MVPFLVPQIESSHPRVRGEGGDHANFLTAPGCDHNQNSLRVGFSHLYDPLFTVPVLQRHVNWLIPYNLFSLCRTYPVLGNMVSIGLIPIEILWITPP